MVSVVIPVYNAGKALCRAVDSVLSQSFTDYEIIIVDDGSTDDTPDIIKGYGDKIRYIRQENSGASIARNAGIQAAQGRWIAFLDADDQWLPEKLKKQIGLLSRNPDLVWCAGNFIQTDGARSAPRIRPSAIRDALAGRDYIENYFEEAAKGRCIIQTSTVIVEKCVFDKTGLFDPHFLRAQDTDMWWRIAHAYPKIGFIAEPAVKVFMDIHEPTLQERRLEVKSGKNARLLMNKHLKLANRHGDIERFKMFAEKFMRSRLGISIYHGYKNESRTMIREFKGLFPWYWRIGAYLLTAAPKLTHLLGSSLLYFRYRLGLEKNVTRRWLYSKSGRSKGKK